MTRKILESGDLSVTAFHCGKNKGQCFQIDVVDNFIVLTKEQAEDVAFHILNFTGTRIE